MRKLQLNRESIRLLTDVDLKGIVTGREPLSDDCGDPVPRPTELIEDTCQGYTHLGVCGGTHSVNCTIIMC